MSFSIRSNAMLAIASRCYGIHAPDLSERLMLYKLRKAGRVVSLGEFASLTGSIRGPLKLLACDDRGFVVDGHPELVVKRETIPLKERITIPTHLERAIRKKNLSEITKLVMAGADVNAHDDQGQTPLFKAVKTGNPKVVDLLLKLKADPNIYETSCWNYNITPFHKAIQLNHYPIVKLFIEKWNIPPDLPVKYSDYGWPPNVISFVQTSGLGPHRLKEAKKILALLKQ